MERNWKLPLNQKLERYQPYSQIGSFLNQNLEPLGGTTSVLQWWKHTNATHSPCSCPQAQRSCRRRPPPFLEHPGRQVSWSCGWSGMTSTSVDVIMYTLHTHFEHKCGDLTLTICLTSCLSRQPLPSRSYTLKDHFNLSVSLPRSTRFTAATNSMKSIWPSCWEETRSCQSSMLNACPCIAEDLILNWLRPCSKFLSFSENGLWLAVHGHVKWRNHRPGRSRASSLSRHLISIEGAEHVVHVGVLLLRRAAGYAKYLLELMKMQLPAGTLTGELSVELLDVLQGHLLLQATLRLAHSHRHENPRWKGNSLLILVWGTSSPLVPQRPAGQI